MAAFPPAGTSLEEFLTNAGVKTPAEIAEKLTEEEIESIQDLLDIEESIMLTILKNCGIKAGSASKIHAYCQKVKGGGVAASAVSGGGGGGGAAAVSEGYVDQTLQIQQNDDKSRSRIVPGRSSLGEKLARFAS